MIASIILCASLIIEVLSITRLGVKITSLILSGSGGLLWPSLLLNALAYLLLGMEVPTAATYVICVSIVGPALIQLGLEPLQAHLFVFWVCAVINHCSAFTSMTLGDGFYIIPMAMIANPELTQFGSSPLMALFVLVKVGQGLRGIACGVIAPIWLWVWVLLIMVECLCLVTRFAF